MNLSKALELYYLMGVPTDDIVAKSLQEGDGIVGVPPGRFSQYLSELEDSAPGGQDQLRLQVLGMMACQTFRRVAGSEAAPLLEVACKAFQAAADMTKEVP